MTVRIALTVLFLAYYWTGLEMVIFHTSEPAYRRPMYANYSFLMKAIAGILWPITSARTRELGWFLACFTGSSVAIGATVFLLIHWLSFFWAVMIIGFIRFVKVPIISPLYCMMVSFSGALFAKVFRISIPESMERFAR